MITAIAATIKMIMYSKKFIVSVLQSQCHRHLIKIKNQRVMIDKMIH